MSGPVLLRPGAPLSAQVQFFGYWQNTQATTHRSRALPRGAATVIIDLGSRERVDFYAADATTRLDVGAAFIAGAGITSYVTQIGPSQTVLTIHFRPGGASAFFPAPMDDLEDSCVDLEAIWGRDGSALRARLIDASSMRARVAIVESFLLARMRSRDPAVDAVLRAAEHRPSLRVTDACALTGLSARRLIASFRAEVGLTPKTYLRVRRFQAAMRLLDTGDAGGARIAADLGYFDQAHFVREFRSFTAMTPTQYTQRRTWLPSHVGISPTR
ncbi:MULTISPECIES: helix-turn-helix transcriptional regulator [unclassified Mycolicibacterium]|uniref:helix-turn-helix transcriptional regulator n=1 Tax=unclassified Mycolicibacterium TaxID=2636767 RepID=UPI00130BF293|nr:MULTISPECIES: helix-turn-helix transcriptional regulator [unclassified Mycolicibacterium]MUL82105.1 helix-turn-helix transcriptional regulator [Mycolicibacterium sp. CBMA 329]MUL87871.1 helix-turn-helix transcriptional regulator [Mycolicibacterium sp. CBMA 331]MUM01694.1 helix-turn-helix transcriptional regulator [Mycolicibacterium sp. CBMA 334]MUM28429.1 helix-turn-helix transcriptional regulator [Mycolicibacterium sp. CBMA 295]MUM38168.1 helix-turn-helix transcriptional regulator [Mycolic